MYAKRGRIPPPPVADEGGRSPNEQRLLDEGACRHRLKVYCELRGEAKFAKEICSERGFSFLSDFLTVKEKDTDFFLHKKICTPNESPQSGLSFDGICLNSAYFQPFIQIDTLFTSCYNSSGA